MDGGDGGHADGGDGGDVGDGGDGANICVIVHITVSAAGECCHVIYC